MIDYKVRKHNTNHMHIQLRTYSLIVSLLEVKDCECPSQNPTKDSHRTRIPYGILHKTLEPSARAGAVYPVFIELSDTTQIVVGV